MQLRLLALAVALAVVVPRCEANNGTDLTHMTVFTKVFKPFIFLDERGNITGISAEIKDQLCAHLNLTCTFASPCRACRAIGRPPDPPSQCST